MKKTIKIVNLDGQIISEQDLNQKLLVDTIKQQSLFDAVLAEDAANRQGTHSTLTKSEVSGGGKKPFKQKHTGRARQGSIRNPHYRHGGVAFGPKPNRNYQLKVNRKVYHLAFKSALTIKSNENSLYGLTDSLSLSTPSTKIIVKFLQALQLSEKKVLFVTLKKDDNLAKSIANLEKVSYKIWHQVSPKDLLHANCVAIQPAVLTKWMEVYA